MHTAFIKPCSALYQGLENYGELLHNYEVLSQDYQALQGKHIALQATASYAHDVEKELVWFKKRYQGTATGSMVSIMGLHCSDRQHTMLIEGGSDRGFEKDMVVLADNVLVGKITTVYPWYSIVQLITDPTSCVSVYGVGSGAHGIVRGTGAPDMLHLERVDHLSPVQEQELLLSSGDGLVIPRGYGVGLVERYSSDGLYYSGSVQMLHSVAHLKSCLVFDRKNC
jgi:cell shape-determining protein MreC